MRDWKGVIIAEGLNNPTLINKFLIYRATITEDGMAIDYRGNVGRWHIYYVKCSRKELTLYNPTF